MSRIAIIGAGDLGHLLARHIDCSPDDEVAGFFDDYADTSAHCLLGRTDDVELHFSKNAFDALLIGVGYCHFGFRQQLYQRLSPDIPFATLRHPSAWIAPDAQTAAGSVILPGTVLDAGVNIGPNVLINAGVTIAHDSSVSSHSFIAPGVTIAGFVNVGERVFLGTGTTVIDGLNICDDARTGAGAVVTTEIRNPGLYLGVPARLRE